MKSVILSSLVPLVAALTWDGPLPTAAVVRPDCAGPQPTQGPVTNEELRRRAINAGQTLVLAPDNTCGFAQAFSTASVYCDATETCGFGVQSNLPGNLFCGTGTNSNDYYSFRTLATCYDLPSQISSCLNNTGCATKDDVLLCSSTTISGSDYPLWCESRTFPDVSVTYLRGCDTSSRSSYVTVYLTSSGGPVRVLTTPGVPITTPSSSGSSSTSTTSSSSSSSSTVPPTPTPAPSKSSTPVGAIVGGVIGGLAVIAIAAVAIFFLLRRSKKKHAAGAAAAPPPQQPYGPTGGAPGYGQQPQMGQPMYSPQGQQGVGYYAPDHKAAGAVHTQGTSPHYSYQQPMPYQNNGQMYDPQPGYGGYAPQQQPYGQPQQTSPGTHNSMLSEMPNNAAHQSPVHGSPPADMNRMAGGGPPVHQSGPIHEVA